VSPEYKATFSLQSKTRVRLAGDRAGVLLEVDRGSLRALFDALSVDEAQPLFEAVPAIRSRLEALQRVGLGYLSLEGLKRAVGGEEGFCSACFSGRYPIPVKDNGAARRQLPLVGV